MAHNSTQFRVAYEDDEIAVVEVLVSRLLDSRSIDEFGETLFALADAGQLAVVLDLSGVEYLSSSVIGKLVGFSKKMETFGGRWAICGVGREIREVFQINRLHKLFQVTEEREAALQTLRDFADQRRTTVATTCPVAGCAGVAVSSLPAPLGRADERESWTIACPRCGARVVVRGVRPSPDLPSSQVAVRAVTIGTYADEQLELTLAQVRAQSPESRVSTLRVRGRLDLFAAEAVIRVWESLAPPRPLVLDLSAVEELSAKGIQAIVERRRQTPADYRLAVLDPADREHALLEAWGETPRVSQRAAAAGALEADVPSDASADVPPLATVATFLVEGRQQPKNRDWFS